VISNHESIRTIQVIDPFKRIFFQVKSILYCESIKISH